MSNASNGDILQLPIPVIGDINKRTLMKAITAGTMGGLGIGAATGLLRYIKSIRDVDKQDSTDDESIVITLPKQASDGYASMSEAKPGETKITTNGGRQFRVAGKFGKRVAPALKTDDTSVKRSSDAPMSTGTMVASTVGLLGSGIASYELISRLVDKANERRLKAKLQAAQQAYADVLSGASKRAEVVLGTLDRIAQTDTHLSKEASRVGNFVRDIGGKLVSGAKGVYDSAVKSDAADVVRYPLAAYVLASLAGSGAVAYTTKKILDREFPEAKLLKDVNMPSRIVFRTTDGAPSLLEGAAGEEKQASAETCAALSAMLPIYMDVVEGAPNRTLSGCYVKFAEEIGTDSAGLMKQAQADMWGTIGQLIMHPGTLWKIVTDPSFRFSNGMKGFAGLLNKHNPGLYGSLIRSNVANIFKSNPGAGFLERTKNKALQHATDIASRYDFGRRLITEKAIPAMQRSWQSVKSGEAGSIIRSSYIIDTLLSGTGNGGDTPQASPGTDAAQDDKEIRKAVRKVLKSKRKVQVTATDPAAAKYVADNKARINKVLSSLNSRGML